MKLCYLTAKSQPDLVLQLLLAEGSGEELQFLLKRCVQNCRFSEGLILEKPRWQNTPCKWIEVKQAVLLEISSFFQQRPSGLAFAHPSFPQAVRLNKASNFWAAQCSVRTAREDRIAKCAQIKAAWRYSWKWNFTTQYPPSVNLSCLPFALALVCCDCLP